MIHLVAPNRRRGVSGLAVRLAWRELRGALVGGFRGFRVFLGCLALGVAVIAAVGSLSSALVEGLAEDGQALLGGDVDVRLVHRDASAEERAFLGRDAEVSRIMEVRAMARAPQTDERTLVELKAVDEVYPLYGAVVLEPAQPLNDALAEKDGRWGIAVEQSLLDRLRVAVGDVIKVGAIEVDIRARVVREPDRATGGFTLGPRGFLSEGALAATALIQPGSLAHYHYRIRLPERLRSMAEVRRWTEALAEAFPKAGWRVQDRSDSAPGVRRFVERIALFLSLVGLTALAVGGVGVGNAVKAYLDTKRATIATLKCLGAPGALVFRLYLTQVLALALVGIAIGLALGAVVPLVAVRMLGDVLPVAARFAVYPAPLALAAAYGGLTALGFALWPLARAREIPASSLFRDIIAPVRRWPRPPYVAAAGAALGGLGGLAVGFSDDPWFAAWFVAGVAASFMMLRLAAAGLAWAARRAGRPRHAPLRLALANLYRPGAPTPSAVLSLGLGLTLLVAISLIDGNVTRQIGTELPARAPAFFFVDVQADQIDGFMEMTRATPGVWEINRVPMLRGRIVRLAGVAAEDIDPPSDVAWALQGDRGITYADALPEGSTLTAGAWWDKTYDGPPLVSLSQDLADGFGLGLGDTLTVNVLGRNLTATIANMRKIDWMTVGINFVMVFSPSAVRDAPHTYLATVTMDAAQERALQRAVTERYPNVTSVRVKEALDTLNGLVGNLALGMRAMSAVALIAGVLVLAGAMAAGYRARVYDAVMFKVLGATRGDVLRAYFYEYGLLGLGTALIAAAAGTLAAWLVITQVMDAVWVFLPVTLLMTVLGAVLVTILLGFAGTWRALGVRAASILRAE